MTPSSATPRIAYVATSTMPSTETDTEQTVRSFEALFHVDPASELVLARTRSGAEAHRAVVAAYRADAALPIRFYPGSPAKRWEAERLHNALAAVSAWRGRYDIIVTRSRGTAIAATVLGQPFAFETYRDLARTNPFFFVLLKRMARRPALLGVICHSRQAADALRKAGIADEKLGVFHNGYQPELFAPPLEAAEARAKLGLPRDVRIITYTGNLQHGKGVETLLEIARMRPEILLNLVGGKAEDQARIERLARDMGVSNVILSGHHRPDGVALHLQAADVLAIPPSAEPQARFRRTLLPIKTFVYLGAGRPIMAPDTPDLREVLTDGRDALLIRPDDLAEAVAALDRLLHEPGLARRLGSGALETARKHSWQSRARALREWLIERKSASG